MNANLRAFTVKPMWGFLIMQGYKDCENRNIAPVPNKGTAAVHVSASFTKAEYAELLKIYGKDTMAKLPFEMLRDLCGKIIGLVDYEVKETTTSQWWDKSGKPIMLTNPRWLSEPFVPCKGALQFWHVPQDVAERVSEMLIPDGKEQEETETEEEPEQECEDIHQIFKSAERIGEKFIALPGVGDALTKMRNSYDHYTKVETSRAQVEKMVESGVVPQSVADVILQALNEHLENTKNAACAIRNIVREVE